ncbi:hypothetical protein CB1_000200075 [Camelus ferus]|nr:hypothetical protein CB1_000200075 [Camelus ferus]
MVSLPALILLLGFAQVQQVGTCLPASSKKLVVPKPFGVLNQPSVELDSVFRAQVLARHHLYLIEKKTGIDAERGVETLRMEAEKQPCRDQGSSDMGAKMSVCVSEDGRWQKEGGIIRPSRLSALSPPLCTETRLASELPYSGLSFFSVLLEASNWRKTDGYSSMAILLP